MLGPRFSIFPKSCGGGADIAFEETGKMALIAEASGLCDIDQRLIGGQYEVACVADSKFPNIFRWCAAVVKSESAYEMNGMYSNRSCKRFHGHWFQKSIVDDLKGFFDPIRCFMWLQTVLQSLRLYAKFQHKRFNGKPRSAVRLVKLTM